VQQILGELSDVEERNAPDHFFMMGDPQLLRGGLRVCVIGTRKPTAEGQAHAEAYSGFLARNGVTVVSGLAMGIDTIAHTTAIKNGGRTIAVLGTPLNQVSPVKNRQLQETIGREHLVISQFPIGSKVFPTNFPARNRTMALLSEGTIIIEASETSGTVSQGWEALRLGRPLFILKSVVDARHEWVDKMRDYGAYVLSSPEDLYEVLPIRIRVNDDAPAF